MGAAIVMLREGFEVSLIIGIVLAFLNRTGRRDRFWVVWLGAGAALVISLAVAGLLVLVGSELEGRREAVFEGLTMLAAAGLLTWMIFWMRRQARTLKKEIELHVEEALATGSTFGLALVAFVGVLREGVEAAILLFGTFEGSKAVSAAIGAAIGLVIAIGLGYAFYRGSGRLNLRKFFTITRALLLAFAAWLLVGGLHELMEADVIPESEPLLAAAALALVVPTLYLFFRPARPKPLVPSS